MNSENYEGFEFLNIQNVEREHRKKLNSKTKINSEAIKSVISSVYIFIN